MTESDEVKLKDRLSEHRKPILISVAVFVSVVVIFLVYINLPYLFMSSPGSSPSSFMYISNWDDTSHNIHIEVFDSDDEKVISKEYDIDADSSISYDKRYPSDDYRVNVTMDGTISTEKTVEVTDEWSTIDIKIHNESYSERGYPERIEIGISTV